MTTPYLLSKSTLTMLAFFNMRGISDRILLFKNH